MSSQEVRQRKSKQNKSQNANNFMKSIPKSNSNQNKSTASFQDKNISSQYSSSKSSQKKVKTTSWLSITNFIFGFIFMLVCGVIHAIFMSTLHENWLWFSHIKEVEREISFRTESGLYYSYYKQIVQAKTISEGIYGIVYDNKTEFPSTINVLSRMNIYQEVILAAMYRILPEHLIEPIYFYINSVFMLHAMLVCCLYSLAWMLTGSWLAGVLTTCFYIFNKTDTTRVEYVIPLRECFSLPFLWLQIAAITFYFKPNLSFFKEKLSLAVIHIATFLFALFWQFNQFILLLQAFSLFGAWVLEIVPTYKVKNILISQLVSLFLVCVLQFFNTMIIGSLVVSFILASFLIMYLKKKFASKPTVLSMHLLRVVLFSAVGLILMVVFSTIIKKILNIEADEHIFKFIQSKFKISHTRDFDARVYLCIDAFDFLPYDTYRRLTKCLVFPPYVLYHFGLLVVLAADVFKNWSCSQQKKDHPAVKKLYLLNYKPALLFNAIQCVLFGGLAVSTLRMKYLWTPYMCVLATVPVADYDLWRSILAKFNATEIVVQIFRHLATLIFIGFLLVWSLPGIFTELEDLKEFWDPDTVALMQWIRSTTPVAASFAGSMQLLAGVKLCTGRAITNHPHYEDKQLRIKTKHLYQFYGRRTAEDVHDILKQYNTSYIIMEDSICLAPSKNGCRLPDLLDVDFGVIPDSGIAEPGLVKSSIPRFCWEVRHKKEPYSKYFKEVFKNRTFRVYKVLY